VKEEKRLYLTVTGVVQGVFFRAHTRNAAQNFGLVGWVRNLRDGRVEIVAEGATEKLQELIRWCHRGPRLARVDSVDITWDEATGEFDTFEIRY
jgi:acylphosphatase